MSPRHFPRTSWLPAALTLATAACAGGLQRAVLQPAPEASGAVSVRVTEVRAGATLGSGIKTGLAVGLSLRRTGTGPATVDLSRARLLLEDPGEAARLDLSAVSSGTGPLPTGPLDQPNAPPVVVSPGQAADTPAWVAFATADERDAGRPLRATLRVPTDAGEVLELRLAEPGAAPRWTRTGASRVTVLSGLSMPMILGGEQSGAAGALPLRVGVTAGSGRMWYTVDAGVGFYLPRSQPFASERAVGVGGALELGVIASRSLYSHLFSPRRGLSLQAFAGGDLLLAGWEEVQVAAPLPLLVSERRRAAWFGPCAGLQLALLGRPASQGPFTMGWAEPIPTLSVRVGYVRWFGTSMGAGGVHGLMAGFQVALP